MARHRASLDGVTGRLAFLRKADRVLPPEGLATIAGLEARLRNMQRLWPALEQASAAVPRTIVHGDVQAKNMVVSPAGELLVFDWEHCGFGDPSRDLDRCLDLNVYLETAAERWPWLTREHVERMVSVGDALRLIDAVAWDACRLETPWWGRALRHLEYYSQELGAVEMDCLG
jgi:thiamine kinase-like enzyme